MNYGYGVFCPDWDESKKNFLADRLCVLLREYGFRDVCEFHPGSEPYVEVDGPYAGIRIRRPIV